MTDFPDAAETRRLHGRAREWAQVLKLPFRQQRWRGQSGEFMGTGVGSSLDFQDHRVYIPGDDPRQINWQAYARTGTYTMKLYREEVRPLVDLILDVSESMFAFPAKQIRTLELLAYAVEASLQTGATLRCFLVRGQAHRHVETDVLVSGRWSQEAAAMPGSADPPHLSALPLRAGALRIFLSDLLFPAEPDPLLAALSHRNGRGLILAPFSGEESSPDWDGNYEFQDAETPGLHEHRIEPNLLLQYHQAYGRHFELWKTGSAKHGVALARVSADLDFIPALRVEGILSGAVEIA